MSPRVTTQKTEKPPPNLTGGGFLVLGLTFVYFAWRARYAYPVKRALIYTRQSVAREESISLELQEAACREYAKQRGYHVQEVISDPGVSGLQFAKRPGIRRALDLVEAGGVEVILVWRWSRLSRRRIDQAVIMDRVERAGGRIESATEPVDATTAGGRFSREVLLAAAAMESDVKSEQWKEAQHRRVSRGLPSSGTPRFGYRKTTDGRYEPADVTAPALRQAYLDYIAGAGFQTIVKRLNDRGIRSTRGRELSVHSLIRSLDSGFGAGLLIVRGGADFVDGAHEAVITRAEWESYQRARRRRSVQHPKLQTPKWFLAGIVRCGECGGPMFVNSYSSPKSQVVCSNYKNQRTCTGTWINRPRLEHLVGMWLGGQVDALARHGSDARQRATERARLQTELDVLTTRRLEVEASLGRLATGWATGLIDDTGYRQARAKLDDERRGLDADFTGLHARLDALLPADADIYERLVHITEDMDTGEWNALIKRVVDFVAVTRTDVVITPVVGEQAVISR